MMVSKEEMRAEIQKAVTAALEEVASSSTAAATATRKAKAKAKVSYDETRRAGPDERDPRVSKTQWPCMGDHIPGRGGNRFGLWEQCGRCGLRLSYTPATTAPAQTTHVDLPRNVVEALARLRTGDRQENDVTATEVKAMITIAAKEYQLVKTKDHGYRPKALAKKKAPVEEPSSPGTEISAELISDTEEQKKTSSKAATVPSK